MKKILEKSGKFVRGKKWEPCVQNGDVIIKIECFRISWLIIVLILKSWYCITSFGVKRIGSR